MNVLYAQSIQRSFFCINLGTHKIHVDKTMSSIGYNIIKEVSSSNVNYYTNVVFAGYKWDAIFKFTKDGRLYNVCFIHSEGTPQKRKEFNALLFERLIRKYGIPTFWGDENNPTYEWSDDKTEAVVYVENTLSSYCTFLEYKDILLFNKVHASYDLEL